MYMFERMRVHQTLGSEGTNHGVGGTKSGVGGAKSWCRRGYIRMTDFIADPDL